MVSGCVGRVTVGVGGSSEAESSEAEVIDMEAYVLDPDLRLEESRSLNKTTQPHLRRVEVESMGDKESSEEESSEEESSEEESSEEEVVDLEADVLDLD